MSIFIFLIIRGSMKSVWFWQLNIRTASESNSKEHWTVKAKRHRKQKSMIKKIFLSERPKVKPPCTVLLTRIAPGTLDAHDNLPISFKWIVDAIADYLCPGQLAGRADDNKLIEWKYSQKRGKPREYAIQIEIRALS